MKKNRLDILKSVFGYSEFREFQQNAIDAILEGRDLLMILPTGGGKSLCYQLPSLLMDGVTVVVSPLLALMHDQVASLKELGIKAEMVSSMQTLEEIESVNVRILSGDVKIVYVAPERMAQGSFMNLLKQARVNFFVIDEAHCVSEWGHEFREDYRRLGRLKEEFPSTPIAAFTATATKAVKDDIIANLGLKSPEFIRAKVFRPNLRIDIQTRVKDGRKQLLDFLELHEDESGIIYAFTRKQVDSLAEFLNSKGIKAGAYHAGLETANRNSVYKKFVHDEIDIVVATVAFGMGIDKSNIRFVVHMSLPKTIENYYQEIGRAGRDGLESEVLLLTSQADIVQKKQFIDQLEESLYKKSAYDKLNAIARFATSEKCHHQQIAEYFGDMVESCGDKCDNCLNPNKEKTDITIESQKLISAIYRTGERFGKNYVIDILRGSKEQKIAGNGHDELSVYGIGKELSKEEWFVISDRLLELGALSLGEYQTLKIEDAGREILTKKREVKIRTDRLEIKKPKRAKQKAEHGDYDGDVFERFKELRKEIATQNSIPAYIVFGDKTLKEMASILPQNRDEMLEVSGVGEVKFERYGERFLELCHSLKG